MIAITGCARSGTAYASAALRHFGYDVGHEELRADGVVAWPIAAATLESPWGPSPAKILTIADAVFHQVREPIATIRSLHTLSAESWDFICATTSCRPTDPLLVRCAQYWVRWNEMAEDVAERTYRLEAIRDEIPALCRAFERRPVRYDIEAVPRMNARPNVSGPLDWDDLRRASVVLAQETAGLARRYGYSAPEV